MFRFKQECANYNPFNRRVGYGLAALLLTLTLSACGSGSGDGDPIVVGEPDDGDGVPIVVGEPDDDDGDAASCTAAGQNQWAYDSMTDYYLFKDQVPVVNPQDYESASDLVKRVRFEERDQFSNVSDTAESNLAFAEGREFGLGFAWAYDSEYNARITIVVSDSPFGRAGVERGDIIVSVDGLLWSDEELNVNFGDRVVGTTENPSTANWGFIKRDTGQTVAADITAAEYTINTVLSVESYTLESFNGNIGYLAFSRFLSTSTEELNLAFGKFREDNITELVLDLRYNGGGLISIARYLASLIRSNSEADDPIITYEYNDNYTQDNFSLDFISGTNGLELDRVIVLTSNNTASSSEIVIAGLQPYMEVVTIGGRTRGKPFISRGRDQCGERLNLLEAEGFNNNGVSVDGGIAADCHAYDDLTQNFGLSDTTGALEGMLAAGLDYIVNSNCNSLPVADLAKSSKSTTATGNEMSDRNLMFNTDGAILD